MFEAFIAAAATLAATWWSARKANKQQGFQNDQARAAWDHQEQRRLMFGRSVMSILEKRPDFRERIPQPLLDWITRPPGEFTGDAPTSNAFVTGLVQGGLAGASTYSQSLNRPQPEPFAPIPDLGAGFGGNDNAFFVDAGLTGQTAGQGAMQQAQPVQNDEFTTIPNLTGRASFGRFLPPEGKPLPEGDDNLSTNWPSLIADPEIARRLAAYFREGAGP